MSGSEPSVTPTIIFLFLLVAASLTFADHARVWFSRSGRRLELPPVWMSLVLASLVLVLAIAMIFTG